MAAGVERSPGALLRFACIGAAAAGVYGFCSPEKGSVRERAFPRGTLCSDLAWMIIAISGTLPILFLLYAFLPRTGVLWFLPPFLLRILAYCYWLPVPAGWAVALILAYLGKRTGEESNYCRCAMKASAYLLIFLVIYFLFLMPSCLI